MVADIKVAEFIFLVFVNSTVLLLTPLVLNNLIKTDAEERIMQLYLFQIPHLIPAARKVVIASQLTLCVKMTEDHWSKVVTRWADHLDLPPVTSLQSLTDGKDRLYCFFLYLQCF